MIIYKINIMNSTKQIPKAEIHVHLEATISPDLCRKFAKRNNVEISEDLFGICVAFRMERAHKTQSVLPSLRYKLRQGREVASVEKRKI